jgi:hypothetical protein
MPIETPPNNLESLKQRYLKDFSVLRNDYIEDIPDEILQPEMPNYHRYKYRQAFFSSIASHISRMQREGITLSPEASQQYKEFDSYLNTLRGNQRRLTIDDIDKANKILDTVIEELS